MLLLYNVCIFVLFPSPSPSANIRQFTHKLPETTCCCLQTCCDNVLLLYIPISYCEFSRHTTCICKSMSLSSLLARKTIRSTHFKMSVPSTHVNVSLSLNCPTLIHYKYSEHPCNIIISSFHEHCQLWVRPSTTLV